MAAIPDVINKLAAQLHQLLCTCSTYSSKYSSNSALERLQCKGCSQHSLQQVTGIQKHVGAQPSPAQMYDPSTTD
jgi:hypothetical protein